MALTVSSWAKRVAVPALVIALLWVWTLVNWRINVIWSQEYKELFEAFKNWDMSANDKVDELLGKKCFLRDWVWVFDENKKPKDSRNCYTFKI